MNSYSDVNSYIDITVCFVVHAVVEKERSTFEYRPVHPFELRGP